jgi:hypothetical protein
MPKTEDLVKKLINDLATHQEITVSAPYAFFTAPAPQKSSHHVNALQKSPHTPPRSPCDLDKMGRRAPLEADAMHPFKESPPKHEFAAMQQNMQAQMAAAHVPAPVVETKSQQQSTAIPQFYFPGGKGQTQDGVAAQSEINFVCSTRYFPFICCRVRKRSTSYLQRMQQNLSA